MDQEKSIRATRRERDKKLKDARARGDTDPSSFASIFDADILRLILTSISPSEFLWMIVTDRGIYKFTGVDDCVWILRWKIDCAFTFSISNNPFGIQDRMRSWYRNTVGIESIWKLYNKRSMYYEPGKKRSYKGGRLEMSEKRIMLQNFNSKNKQMQRQQKISKW